MDAPELTKERARLDKWTAQNPRDELALALFAAWVNCPVDKLPEKMKGHTCPATMAAWSRVADIPAARIAELEAENARLRVARDDAIATLNVWFDRRKLAHEAIDETVLNATRGYLRTSRSGGLDQETSDMIEGVIADMAQLSVFADLFARAALGKKEG